MMKRWCCLFAVLSLCLPLETQAETFKTEEFFLDNGLQVVVIENHKAPIIKQMLFYKAGAVDEAPGKGGIAHLLEHLMFRGTAKVRGQRLNRVLEENGAESNAFTSQDVTAYHQFLDISRLELAMFLEADRMQGLEISEKDFATERDIVFQERKQRVDNNPAARFYETLNSALWQEHPYGRPVTGYDREITALERQDAVDFYRTYYAPNNAVLVLSGDIDKAAARRLAQKYYGHLRPSQIKSAEFAELPPFYKAKVEMSLPEVRLGRLVKLFAVSSFAIKPEEAYVLEVLAEYLAGDENAPLYQELVLRRKKALAVNAGYNGLARSYGTFSLSVVPAGLPDDAFVEAVDRAWRKALEDLDEEKLERVKRKMLADLVYLKDNPESLAQLAGYMAATGTSLDVLRNYAVGIEQVSAEEVKKAAEELWRQAPQATGILYPEEKNNG